jgi:NADPH:quinone reductase-like Zn-dependent oxidoreductase
LKKAKLRSGEKVLVNGASGGVGTAAVQLARHFGADVTSVCSAANVELVQSLGASRVIDYAQQDSTASGETYDVIVDAAGTAPFRRSKRSLNDGGRLLHVLGDAADLRQTPWVRLTGSKRILAGTFPVHAEDLRFLAELAENGAFKPVIDRPYPLDQIVEAHRYVDAGHKRGNVVIRVAP